ncbi:MAG TPA: hypothetical protein V6D12_14290 [Candidatus Obscuribacterales bacterium]
MNHVIAQGAPGSLIRKFQDHPELGVELLEIARGVARMLGNTPGLTTQEKRFLDDAREAIAKAEGAE